MDTNNNNIMEGNQTPSSPSPIVEQTYIENILRLNIGKLGTFYFTYTGSDIIFSNSFILIGQNLMMN